MHEKRVPFFNKKVYKRATFSAKMVYKRVRGWTAGRSLPVLNFVKYPPPPPGNRLSSERIRINAVGIMIVTLMYS